MPSQMFVCMFCMFLQWVQSLIVLQNLTWMPSQMLKEFESLHCKATLRYIGQYMNDLQCRVTTLHPDEHPPCHQNLLVQTYIAVQTYTEVQP